MITEDYVSFETAKLLKEKGFPQEYDIYHSMVYNEEDYEDEYEVQRMVLGTRLVKEGILSSYPIGVPEPKCYCPTLQMAMKWLREERGLFIEICCDDLDYDWQIFDVWHRDSNGDPTVKSESYGGYSEYEEAVKTALMFLLRFLI